MCRRGGLTRKHQRASIAGSPAPALPAFQSTRQAIFSDPAFMSLAEFSDPKDFFQRGFSAMRNMEDWPMAGSWDV